MNKIEVDDEIFGWLQRHAQPFEDTPNSVLRRIAGLDVEEAPARGNSKMPRRTHPSSDYSDPILEGGRQMNNTKFDEQDRKKVIAVVERYYQTKLRKPSSRRKLFVDEDSSVYWILGGYEDWHGAPGKMVDHARNANADSKLIIAKKKKDSIEVYAGNLCTLIENIEDCSLTKQGDRQFNLLWRNGIPSIREVPQMKLQFLEKIYYPDKDKESDKKFEDIAKLFDAMTPAQRQLLTEKLETK